MHKNKLKNIVAETPPQYSWIGRISKRVFNVQLLFATMPLSLHFSDFMNW